MDKSVKPPSQSGKKLAHFPQSIRWVFVDESNLIGQVPKQEDGVDFCFFTESGEYLWCSQSVSKGEEMLLKQKVVSRIEKAMGVARRYRTSTL